jgi:UPF0271 protein
VRRFDDPARAHIAFVKPHGALYHAVSERPDLARAFAETVRRTHPDAALVAAAGSPALGVWRAMDADAWPEAFADRGYGDGGRLLPRSEPGSVITDPAGAAEQARHLAGSARAVCVHGDTPGALAIARAVRAALAGPRAASPHADGTGQLP